MTFWAINDKIFAHLPVRCLSLKIPRVVFAHHSGDFLFIKFYLLRKA
nr:MAG TPA: hypothetical protein [Caudoviricetes sp.]